MYYLFEQSDSLNTPVECFIFDASHECFPVRSHWHYFVEIIYMLEGQAQMQANDESFILNEGEMIVFHPKSVHSIYAADSSPLKYAVLKFDINKFSGNSSYAPKIRSIFKCAQSSGMDVSFSAEDTEKMECEPLFMSCIEEMKSYSYGFDIIVRSNIYRLLMSIVRKWLSDGLKIDSSTYPAENETDIDSVTEFIDGHMNDRMSVAQIAKKCGMSYSGFAKKFSEVYGMTCKEYIERMRIFKVEELLLFTDFDLNYISQETGFSDCSHMIKSFRNIRGTTPKQFRMAKRSK